MRTKWVKGKHGLPELRYAVNYNATVKRKGMLGISYKTTERCVAWVDWKTYKRIKYKPYSIEEMMFYDSLFGD